MSSTPELQSEIAQSMTFEHIRYSQVWEDHLLLEQGLQIQPQDDVLSICSGGCNALALLLLGPKSITTIDMNPAQSALLELKLAGIRSLEHQEFICLVGAREGLDRIGLFQRVKHQLSDAAAAFWEAHLEEIDSGLTQAGRLDCYIKAFVEHHLPALWPAGLVERLFRKQPLADQARLFLEEAATPEFRKRFRWYFGQENMAASGRDPAQFEHVQETEVGALFLQRFEAACTQLSLHDNFYMEHFLTAQYRDLNIGPPYLRAKNFPHLKALVDRVHIHTGELEEFLYTQPAGAFSKANLSDIFEYMSAGLSDSVFQALGERLRTGGRVAYWNILVTRSSPDSMRHLLQPKPTLSQHLHLQDRSWFYQMFQIEEVL